MYGYFISVIWCADWIAMNAVTCEQLNTNGLIAYKNVIYFIKVAEFGNVR
jgi:hypothetical protein